MKIISVNIPQDIPLSELQFRPVEEYRFQEAATEEEIQTMLAKWKTGEPIPLEEYDDQEGTSVEKPIPFPALAVFTIALAMGFSAIILIIAILRKRD